jgi:hypothetical protein
VFLRVVAKMSDRLLEQRINIKFLCEIRKECKRHLSHVLRGLWGGDMDKSSVFEWYNSSKRARNLKSQIKKMLITFFDIKGTVRFEFVPQDQTVNQVYYMGYTEAVI